MEPKFLDPATLALHAGQRAGPGDRRPRGADLPDHVLRLRRHRPRRRPVQPRARRATSISRISNPTVAVLEERIAALEGGVGAVATASGQAALHLAIATLMGAGAHIVASARLYGGSRQPAAADPAALRHRRPASSTRATRRPSRRAIRPETRLLFARDARQSRASRCSTSRPWRRSRTSTALPLLIDTTFTTPCLCRPIEHGADIVVHSATKWLGGHGVAIGGDRRRRRPLRLARPRARFPTMTEPYAGYPRHRRSPTSSARRPSPRAPAPRACAISAPA